MIEAQGDYIAGRWQPPQGERLTSENPASDGETVFATATDPKRVDQAAEAAADAARGWAGLSRSQRFEHLTRFRAALSERAETIAEAIVVETGKLRSEARTEVSALVGRFDMVRRAAESDLAEGPVAGHPNETLRFHALGVVGVIGPFNYPLHLCHAHAIPALLLGNAVVIKPSEITPLCAQRYAEAAHAAELPPGVFNLVQGTGLAGRALAAHPAVRGICFTGSYDVGRQLTEQLVTRPEVLLALEMGGKNTAVVLDDADIRQAAHEIVVGGYLTTGQRCTATDRVLVHRARAEELCSAVARMVRELRFGDPDDAASFAGPLTTGRAVDRFQGAVAAAIAAGAEPLVPFSRRGPGHFVSATVHVLPAGATSVAGYSDIELFAPDVSITSVEDDDEAIAILEASPYGLANSVFTTSDERFERFYRDTHSGILNRNRSTNMASPRLPFGGLGRSGNYRPAGAYAGRNVVAAVAVQENVIGRLAVHPMLVDHMPPPELDRLDSQHSAEERAEAERSLLDSPRPMAVTLPEGGNLPRSGSYLTRLYAAERVVREKKPPVFDHLRSAGPYLVSVDDEPLSVLDGMSQTATLVGGFAENEVVCAYTEGVFDGTLVETADPAIEPHPAAEEYAAALGHLVPELEHVAFANSGAEANEKALALARLAAKDPRQRRVLAFEGSFHGRTLLALHATWNPKKRAPFEFAGCEALFAPFPVWGRPGTEPDAPSGFYAAAGHADIDDLAQRFGDLDEDPLLAAEVASLRAVHHHLAGGEVFAVIAEPMQSEGGDRYATARFFRALRLLTRWHEVPLIFDEVQTGFALGGPFAWHQAFRLVNVRGQPDYPDAVTFAKRAQVGVCMSVWEDPEPTSVQPASLVRGRIHAEMASTAHSADRIQKLVEQRLGVLAAGFPHLVANPRATGDAFAFDLPSPAHLAAYLGQRFWRGAIVFGAGTRTVRYRLSESYLAREIDRLFVSIRRSLAWLDAHPGAQPPAWEDSAEVREPREQLPEPEVRELTSAEALELLPAILDIEYRSYEPVRRTSPAAIREALEDAEGVFHVAEVAEDDSEPTLVAFAIGHPLEAAVEHTEGPDRDPMLGRANTLYSMSLTVAPEFQGRGIGRALKVAQLRSAAARKRDDGSPRYRFVAGRNRVGHTAAMTHLNRAYGAHVVRVLTGQYEDPEGQAIYYRIPLSPWRPEGPVREAGEGTATRLDRGLSAPLATPPESLRRALDTGLLYGPAVNKLTVMNYATPAIVRALEWMAALTPRLPHLYLTSCRDECTDKTIRLLRLSRPDGAVVLGFAGGYVGHTTAAARSLSDPTVHRQGPAHFDWPLVPHPGDVGEDAALRALDEVIEEAGGASAVLGVFAEPVQERTGRTASVAFWERLSARLRDLGVPLVAVEHASCGYRSGQGAFAGEASGMRPDVLIWWGGAHTGYIHVTGALRIGTPLALVSTWDGDELSLVREHHQLRALRRLDVSPGIRALDAAMEAARAAGLASAGMGLYRVIEARARGDEVADALAARGVHLRRFPGGRLGVIPSIDTAASDAERLAAALREIAR